MQTFILNKSSACSTLTFAFLDDREPNGGGLWPGKYESFLPVFKKNMLAAIRKAEADKDPSGQQQHINRYPYSGHLFDEFAFCFISTYALNSFEKDTYQYYFWSNVHEALLEMGFKRHPKTVYNDKNMTNVNVFTCDIPTLVKSLGYKKE